MWGLPSVFTIRSHVLTGFRGDCATIFSDKYTGQPKGIVPILRIASSVLSFVQWSVTQLTFLNLTDQASLIWSSMYVISHPGSAEKDASLQLFSHRSSF
jgi:hypothetical protein